MSEIDKKKQSFEKQCPAIQMTVLLELKNRQVYTKSEF